MSSSLGSFCISHYNHKGSHGERGVGGGGAGHKIYTQREVARFKNTISCEDLAASKKEFQHCKKKRRRQKGGKKKSTKAAMSLIPKSLSKGFIPLQTRKQSFTSRRTILLTSLSNGNLKCSRFKHYFFLFLLLLKCTIYFFRKRKIRFFHYITFIL